MAVPKPRALAKDADDRPLVEAAQRDPANFGELYERYFELLYGYISKRVRDRDIAEDLTAEVFEKALANLKKFEWRGAPFAAWLIRIAANAIADQSKQAAREATAAVDPDELSVEPEMKGIEDRAQLFRLVNELPADQRHVVFERFVEQRSIREIALDLGRSEGAIKQLQFRALQRLRDQMEGPHA